MTFLSQTITSLTSNRVRVPALVHWYISLLQETECEMHESIPGLR